MANTFLNPDQITTVALVVLHQKLNFVGSLNRSYDDSFARDGAKIGTQIRVRLPNQYVLRRGSAMVTQDVTEQSTSLVVATQVGVDVNFSDIELTMNINDLTQTVIEPAMAVIASNIESDALTMAKDVYNQVNSHGSAQTFRNLLQAKKVLNDNLAPADDNRMLRINTQDTVDLADSLKGLFQQTTAIGKQYTDGVMGKTGGFEMAENTLLNTYTRGAGNAAYIVNGAGQTGASLVVSTGAGAGNQGDVFTVAGVFRVHPETKISTGVLQQFVLTAAYAGGAGTMAISPAIALTGGTQNVSSSPANAAVITFAGTASATSNLSLAYHRDAFTFASADLIMPRGVHFASRKVLDGISMRLVQAYDIANDRVPARFDVLFGFKTIRPQLAVRIATN